MVAPEVLDTLQGSLQSGQSLIEGLIAGGHTTEQQILELLAEEFSLALIDPLALDSRQVDHEHQDRERVLETGILLHDIHEGSGKAALFNPLNLDQVDELGSSFSLDLEPFLCSKQALMNALERFFSEKQRALNRSFKNLQKNRPLGTRPPVVAAQWVKRTVPSSNLCF